jgi:cobalamin biosynthesis Mg chelatase CobN
MSFAPSTSACISRVYGNTGDLGILGLGPRERRDARRREAEHLTDAYKKCVSKHGAKHKSCKTLKAKIKKKLGKASKTEKKLSAKGKTTFKVSTGRGGTSHKRPKNLQARVKELVKTGKTPMEAKEIAETEAASTEASGESESGQSFTPSDGAGAEAGAEAGTDESSEGGDGAGAGAGMSPALLGGAALILGVGGFLFWRSRKKKAVLVHVPA